jgi:hypothetical protein
MKAVLTQVVEAQKLVEANLIKRQEKNPGNAFFA